jgi:hypothetical protein
MTAAKLPSPDSRLPSQGDNEALTQALSHYDTHRTAHLESLKALARIPSVSFAGYDPENVKRSAQATTDCASPA